MKILIHGSLIAVLLTGLLMMQPAFSRTIEIDVHGMTCPFCVDSLERKFGKMKSISKVEVSLKLKKIRLETEANAPSIEAIKQTVIDAGFTPTKVTVMSRDKDRK